MAQIKTQINFYFYPTLLFILTAFFNFVLMIHFSLTLTKTLLVNKKYSGIYTAVFLNIVLIAIFFTATAYLLEKKINI